MASAPYERLDAWRACYELAIEVYRLTAAWPRTELYGLTSQVRRAAYSAAANIVEGSARRGGREFRRFLDITLGSLAELEFALRFARDCGIMPPDQWQRAQPLLRRAGSLSGGLARSLRRPAAAPTR